MSRWMKRVEISIRSSGEELNGISKGLFVIRCGF
jgi:hypothetical protein